MGASKGRPRGVAIGRGRYADVYEWDEGHVVKLFKEGLPRYLAKREFVATRALFDAGLPVPNVVEVVTVGERDGLVLERIEGPSMQDRLSAKGPPRTDVVTQFAHTLAKLHASLHQHSIPRLPLQRAKLEEDIARAKGLDEITREIVIEWVGALPDGQVVCHGDLHPRNVLMSPQGPVMIDFLASSRGNPAADVARSLLVMEAGQDWDTARVRNLRRQFRTVYLHRHCFSMRIWPEEVHRWRVPQAAARLAEGFPGEERWLRHIIREGLR